MHTLIKFIHKITNTYRFLYPIMHGTVYKDTIKSPFYYLCTSSIFFVFILYTYTYIYMCDERRSMCVVRCAYAFLFKFFVFHYFRLGCAALELSIVLKFFQGIFFFVYSVFCCALLLFYLKYVSGFRPQNLGIVCV